MFIKLFFFFVSICIFSEPIFFNFQDKNQKSKWNKCYKSEATNFTYKEFTFDLGKISKFNAKKTIEQINCASSIFQSEDEGKILLEEHTNQALQFLELMNRFVYNYEKTNLSPMDRKKAKDFFLAKYDLHSVLIAKVLEGIQNKDIEKETLQSEFESLYKSIFVLHRDFYESISEELKKDLIKKLY